MTLFGLTIIRREKLDVILTCVDAMVEHVETNGGFVNEEGNFQSNGSNQTIASHWSLFRILTQNFKRNRKELS